MSAIFNFSSLITVLLLLICTTAYLREMRPAIFDGGMVSSENFKFKLVGWVYACMYTFYLDVSVMKQ